MTNAVDTTVETKMAGVLRSRLLELARHQDELAAQQAATTPYWKPQPSTVHGHRRAADALRAEADQLLRATQTAQRQVSRVMPGYGMNLIGRAT